jgi:hypothetical protein
MKKVLCLGVIHLLFSACALREHQKSESTNAAEKLGASHDLTVDRIFSSGPAEGAYRYYSTNSPTLPLIYEKTHVESRSSQNAGSEDAASGESESSIPAGVKWCFAAVGALALFFVARFIWGSVKASIKSTATGQAASVILGQVDSLVGSHMQGWESHLDETLDAKEKAEASAELTDLNKLRGKLKNLKVV